MNGELQLRLGDGIEQGRPLTVQAHALVNKVVN